MRIVQNHDALFSHKTNESGIVMSQLVDELHLSKFSGNEYSLQSAAKMGSVDNPILVLTITEDGAIHKIKLRGVEAKRVITILQSNNFTVK